MSKLSFRNRNPDPSKPMPVFKSGDIPDLPDFAQINRSVPQMPTGMEKEEECEHHLQRAISAQQAFGRAVDHVIPTPEVFPVDEKQYDDIYPPNYKRPEKMIQVQLQSIEPEYPEYDMDSEDEEWLRETGPVLKLSPTRFEEMIECFENASAIKVTQLSETKSLLPPLDESAKISVYDYWLAKKMNVRKSLIPVVKTERRDGTSGTNPYIAFRRRTEKMQTRKNRKNDEFSYEKMLRLKRDFLTAKDLVDLLQKRELCKHDILEVELEIFDERYKMKDFNSRVYNELNLSSRSVKDLLNRQTKTIKQGDEIGKRKRTKRTKNEVLSVRNIMPLPGEFLTSEEENSTDIYQSSQIRSETDDADNPDGIFSFKRKKGCHYHAPLDNFSGWPWEPPEEGGLADKRFRFFKAELSFPPNYNLGFVRPRRGRGGRVIIDTFRPHHFKSHSADDDPKADYYIPSPHQSNIDENTKNFNVKQFEEDSAIFLNNQIEQFNEENLLEKQLYLYNESELLSCVETYRHQQQEQNQPSPKSPEKPTSPSDSETPNRQTSKTNLNQNEQQRQFVRPIDVEVSDSILDTIANLNSSKSTTATTNSENIDTKNNDMLCTLKDSDRFPVMIF